MEIQGYPNYLIYDDGRVFSKKRRIFLSPGIDNLGYHRISVYKDCHRKNFQVHRLVAIHYIPNPENKKEIDHIDRNPSNNHVSNLRWATRSENNQNTIVQKNNRLGFKNIYFHEIGKCYRYNKRIRGELHYKDFKTLEEAIAYKEEYELNQM